MTNKRSLKPKKDKSISEAEYTRQIKKYLDQIPNAWYVKFFGCTMTRAGVPDLLCCINGYFIAIEIKSEKGIKSQQQKEQIKKIQNAGGYAYFVYPKDFDDLKTLIIELSNKKASDHICNCHYCNSQRNSDSQTRSQCEKVNSNQQQNQ